VLVSFLSSCVDSEPVGPGAPSLPTPAAAIIDGSTTGSAEFYFLPPLVPNPTISGTFNPSHVPEMEVCELNVAGTACVPGAPTAYFPPGSATVSGGQYQISWDTDGPETGLLDPDLYYRLRILVGGEVMGSIDLDPQDPDGPGQSEAPPGFYPFRLGETIPVKFWLSTQVLCEVDGIVVLECISNAVFDESGGELTLDEEGVALSVFLPAFALPGDDHPPILVRAERVDPDAFAAAEGVECLPLFDAPQFGPCFRLTTFPQLTAPLDAPALISICIDPGALPINTPLDQEDELQIVRYATDGSNVTEALTNVAANCPTVTGGLIDVPESGLFRFAARGINAVARFLGPQPALAHGSILLGGLSSSFSRFRFALPGQMFAVSGYGQLLQASDPAEVEVVIGVIDSNGVPVENAHVHFATGDGTLGAPEADTDADGHATVTWTVDKLTPGTKTLSVTALGLVTGPVDDHSVANYPFLTQTLTVTATVVGVPAAIAQSPTGNIQGTAGAVAGDLTILVTDAGGNPVAGATVDWTGDGTTTGGTITDGAGSATATWTLPTTAGENTMTATVGTVSAEFTATGAPAAAASLVVSGDGQTGTSGSALPQPLTVQVVDQYGNGRSGDAVSWTVDSGGGSISGTSTTDASGSASATWILGMAPGPNTATVVAGGLSHQFSATGTCLAGWGTATVDANFGAAEWACAQSMPFTANISGGGAPAIAYWMNDGSNLYLAVRIQQASMDKTNSLRFDFDDNGDGTPAVDDDIIGYDAGAQSFYDHHLTLKCVNSSQSGCGVADGVPQGAGAAANTGGYTTYELSHPLTGGGPQDFSRSKGQQLGFFLTLRIGNGAQGNTQVPGFRQYQQITIAGN